MKIRIVFIYIIEDAGKDEEMKEKSRNKSSSGCKKVRGVGRGNIAIHFEVFEFVFVFCNVHCLLAFSRDRQPFFKWLIVNLL